MITSQGKKETEKRGQEQAPILKKAALLKYLREGKISSSYKEGNIPVVSVGRLKTLLLEAGYTELALSRSFFGTHTDLKKSKRFTQEKQEKLSLTINSRNRYGLKPNATYDAVEAIKYAVTLSEPDLPEGKDDLQATVLQQLKELEVLKARLRKSGKQFISLSSWAFTLKGEVIFWLNPRDQQTHNTGWFTLDSLNLWLNDDNSSPVFKKTENIKPRKRRRKRKIKGRNNFRAEYKRAIRAHSTTGRLNKRLLNINLMGCPFPDLVKRYSSGASLE